MGWKKTLSLTFVVALLVPAIYFSGSVPPAHGGVISNTALYNAPPLLSPILVLVNSTIYPQISPLLHTLERVMYDENYYYYFITKKVGGETPEEIRNMIREEYASDKLKGAILIGNISLARYEDDVTGEVVSFPYYYMDLNGVWKDTNGDGIIDTPSGNNFPEIWIGIVRSTGDGNNITQIEAYIHRVINYLEGRYDAEVKSGVFVDNDFLYLANKIENSVAYPYVGMDIVDNSTDSHTFLRFLSKEYAYGYMVVHSDGNAYLLKTGAGYEKVYARELKNTGALFYTDLSCYGASFEKGAIANHLLMNKDSRVLGVLTYTAQGYPDAMLVYHIDMAKGMSFGSSLVDYIFDTVVNLTYFNAHDAMLAYLGFPFLKPWRPSGYREIHPLDIYGNEGLLSYAKKYGWKGNGSKDSPIQISHIMIFQPLGEKLLSLSDITLHVEISHCFFLAGYDPLIMAGIGIYKSQNVVIRDNEIYHAEILVWTSRNVVVKDNILKSYSYEWISISVENSSFVDVIDNTIINGTGITVLGRERYVWNNETHTSMKEIYYYSSDINVSYNKIVGETGIMFFVVKDSTMFRNDVEFINQGLILTSSIDNIILENNFTLCFDKLNESQISEELYYFRIYNSHGNHIYLNNFMYRGSPFQYVSFSELISIEDIWKENVSTRNYWNTSKYGNYWEWWALKNDTNDRNHDGIVDYPYVLDANNTDYKPLKKPYIWKSQENRNKRLNLWIIVISIILIIIVIMAGIYGRRK